MKRTNETNTTFSQSNSAQTKKGRYAVIPDPYQDDIIQTASRGGVFYFAVTVFVVTFALTCLLFWIITARVGLLALAVALIVAILACSSFHIAQQWERAVILRLGKFNRVSGPGFFFTIPVIEHCTMRIDQRVRATAFGAEETLTSDLVPLDVDAVLFWVVWDAEKACTEVGNYHYAIQFSAQTALRDAIGRASVAEVAVRRTQLDRELERILEEKVAPWGITILSVEIRDILIPKELQEVMSLEAQAEQRKKARIALMEAEQDIFGMMEEMESSLENMDNALKLRAMHLLYESVHETGGTIVVPSSFSEGFGDIFPNGPIGKK